MCADGYACRLTQGTPQICVLVTVQPGPRLWLGPRLLVPMEAAPRSADGFVTIVKGLHAGARGRRGVITAVRGEDGSPPYLMRWSDGHEISFFPSSDTVIEYVPLPGT